MSKKTVTTQDEAIKTLRRALKFAMPILGSAASDPSLSSAVRAMRTKVHSDAKKALEDTHD